jgi:hypothetical protein
MPKIKCPEKIKEDLTGTDLSDLENLIIFTNAMLSIKIFEIGFECPYSSKAIKAFIKCCENSGLEIFVDYKPKNGRIFTAYIAKSNIKWVEFWQWFCSFLR